MNLGGPAFVLAIIALSIGGWMFTTWIRAKHGYPVENEWGGTVHRTDVDADRKIALLSDENAKLVGQIGHDMVALGFVFPRRAADVFLAADHGPACGAGLCRRA